MELIQEQYKDTEIGRIPKDWEVVKIGKVADCYGGTTPSTTVEEYWNGDILWATPSDITKNNSEYLLSTDRKITEKGRASKNLRYVQKNGLLMTSRASIGFLNISNGDVVTNQGFINIECKNTYHFKFFYYWIINNRNLLVRYSQGSTFLELYRKTFSKINIPSPPLPEQQKIAEILSTVDEQISTTQAIIDKSKELKKGLMQKLFSEGIGHTEFKDTKIGRIPKDWEVVRLDEIIDFTNGKGHEKFIDENGEYIVVNSKFISQNGNVRKYSNELFSPLEKDDITMVMSDIPNGKALAKCFLIDTDNKYTLNQRICGLRIKDLNNSFPKFYFYVINRNRGYLKYNDGVGQTNLRRSEVLECIPQFPPLPEQQKIAEILSEADAKIEKEENEKAKLEALKKGLMQQLLTGKKRVKV